MHFREVVGVEPAWPNSQPYLALTDLWSGFVAPKIKSIFGNSYDYLEGFDDSKINPGWNLFFDYAYQNEKEIIVYHHADLDELKNKKYSDEGCELTTMLLNSNVEIIEGLQVETAAEFLDNIHVNSQGHSAMSKVIFDKIVSGNLLKLEE